MRADIICRVAATLLAVCFVATARADVCFTASIQRINSGSNLTRDCYPRAWVRAEDLRPGREVRGEARLKVEGDACEGVVAKWQVGLRKRERAIFKFHTDHPAPSSAANITLPERPVMKHDNDDDDGSQEDEPQDDDFVPGDIFSSHRSRSSRKYEKYERKMEEYSESIVVLPFDVRIATNVVFSSHWPEAQVSAKSLWVSRSAVRDVFDTVLDLPLSGTEEDTYHDESASTYLRPFRVNVPATNFPYTASTRSGIMASVGDEDISSVEEVFEYYFLLTYKDGTVLDVPAGMTAFVPASTEEQYERANTLPSVVRPVHLEVPKTDGDRSFIVLNKETPDCVGVQADNGLVSDWKVSVELPHDGILVAGTTPLLNVTIEQLGNSTEVPVQVSLHVKPCKRDTWAATYAFDEQHKAPTTTCDDGITMRPRMTFFRSYGIGDSREESVLMTRQGQNYGEAPEVGPAAMRRHMMGQPQDHGTAHVADGFLRKGTVQMNITIPDHIAFTYNQTLQSVENRLYVRIQTAFSCEMVKPLPSGGARAELLDDDLWSPRWHVRTTPSPDKQARKFGRVTGNVTVVILPPPESIWNASSLLIDYKDPAAKAIVISSIDAPALQQDDYPHVNTLIVESEQDRQLSKFDVYKRLPTCKDYKTHGHCRSGLGDELAGEVWARYQWRKAQDTASAVEKEASPSALTAGDTASMQVVLH
ncbi:hypothetical protein QFC22_006238 [Naganishia vaughanmartiniae]|uniref:Uncharacterized protein n=1 Tax=Naganishia vaughanmartiniae TaxID=1424756 RepID=A0ACC2WPI4_9TREE|nr:hypothetical protein QFC22_006238 [Naganishia vaughanmartiniae]